MGDVTPRLTERPIVHITVAFVLMGSWALYANWEYPDPRPVVAAFIQGTLSGAITFAMKTLLDLLRGVVPQGTGAWLPPLITLTGSLSLLITVHSLTGTPEILRTIAVPFGVATAYALSYNYLMWKKERSHD